MKTVTYKDNRGYLRRVMVRDTDSEKDAPFGVPAGPPDLDILDWEEIKRQINNYFVEQGITDTITLQRKSGLETVANIVKRHIQALFREETTKR